MVLSDIEIANSVQMKPITDIAAELGLTEDDISLYGKYKAKIDSNQLEQLKDKEDGKLIPFLFFGAQAYLLSFLWLSLLLVLIAVMIALFYPIDRTAALLQLPYFLWVLFAGYLNLAIWLLNR